MQYKVSSAFTINRSGTLHYGNTVTVVIICVLQLGKLRDKEDKCLGGLGTVIKQEMLRCSTGCSLSKPVLRAAQLGVVEHVYNASTGEGAARSCETEISRGHIMNLCLRIAQASLLPRLKRHGKITAFQSIELGVRLTEALSPGNCGNRACYFTSPN